MIKCLFPGNLFIWTVKRGCVVIVTICLPATVLELSSNRQSGTRNNHSDHCVKYIDVFRVGIRCYSKLVQLEKVISLDNNSIPKIFPGELLRLQESDIANRYLIFQVISALKFIVSSYFVIRRGWPLRL